MYLAYLACLCSLLELYDTHTGEYTVSEFCQLDIGALTTADDPPAFKKPPKVSQRLFVFQYFFTTE